VTDVALGGVLLTRKYILTGASLRHTPENRTIHYQNTQKVTALDESELLVKTIEG
jgi:hypothetical protein